MNEKELTQEQKKAVRQYWLSRMERDRLKGPLFFQLVTWGTAVIFCGFIGLGVAYGMGAELTRGLLWGVLSSAVSATVLLLWAAGYHAEENKTYEKKKKEHEAKWRWLIDE